MQTRFTIEFVSVVDETTTPPAQLQTIVNMPTEMWTEIQVQATKEIVRKMLETINEHGTWARISLA